MPWIVWAEILLCAINIYTLSSQLPMLSSLLASNINQPSLMAGTVSLTAADYYGPIQLYYNGILLQ